MLKNVFLSFVKDDFELPVASSGTPTTMSNVLDLQNNSVVQSTPNVFF